MSLTLVYPRPVRRRLYRGMSDRPLTDDITCWMLERLLGTAGFQAYPASVLASVELTLRTST